MMVDDDGDVLYGCDDDGDDGDDDGDDDDGSYSNDADVDSLIPNFGEL